MKIEINQRDLAQHISIAQRAISPRSTLQILSGLLLKAQGNSLKIMASDLELYIETHTSCMVHEEGSIVINSNLIGNIVRKLPSEIITIEVEDQKIEIKCGSAHFELIGQDPREYPSLPDTGEEYDFYLNSKVLSDGIKETVFAASEDQSRPYLTGVLFKGNETGLHMVALDGFRIAFKEVPLENVDGLNIIIPARTLNELEKILGEDHEIHIKVSPNYIYFDLQDTKVYSRLIEGNFINYEDIITDAYDTKISVEKRQLQQSLERANLLAATDKANLVKLYTTDHDLELSSNSQIGSVEENIPIEKEGLDLLIGFNANYLLEGLRVLKDGEIDIHLRRSIDPVILRSKDHEDYTYLVLPVRLAGENIGYRD